MDAILGRDDRLVEKIGKACEKLSADFIAVIGTLGSCSNRNGIIAHFPE